MATLNLVYYPDDPLTQTAEPVRIFTPELARLAENMLETMHAYDGVGLAAPQVGIGKRLFVLHEPDGRGMCLVNPTVTEHAGEEEGEEGCLSMPTIYAMVTRPAHVRVQAQDIEGNALDFEADGFLARVIQHEYDHLEGVLFPERLDIITRQGKYQEWAEARDTFILGKAPSNHAT